MRMYPLCVGMLQYCITWAKHTVLCARNTETRNELAKIARIKDVGFTGEFRAGSRETYPDGWPLISLHDYSVERKFRNPNIAKAWPGNVLVARNNFCKWACGIITRPFQYFSHHIWFQQLYYAKILNLRYERSIDF